MDYTEFSEDCTTFDLVTKDNQKFIIHISGSPKSEYIKEFSEFLKSKEITDTFCFCDFSYDSTVIERNNIRFHDLFFPDGRNPPHEIISKFDKIIDEIILQNSPTKHLPIIINMHCLAGMGRAPTMLAYFMISRCGFERPNAIEIIRQRRRGSINRIQLYWILGAKIHKFYDRKTKCIIV